MNYFTQNILKSHLYSILYTLIKNTCVLVLALATRWRSTIRVSYIRKLMRSCLTWHTQLKSSLQREDFQAIMYIFNWALSLFSINIHTKKIVVVRSKFQSSVILLKYFAHVPLGVIAHGIRPIGGPVLQFKNCARIVMVAYSVWYSLVCNIIRK